MSIVDQLNRRLATSGVSKRQLARLSGVSLATIKSITNRRAVPRLDTLEQLAKAVGLELRLSPRQTGGERTVSQR